MMVMVTDVTKLKDQVLQHGKEKEKKTHDDMAKVSNRFMFWHSRHHRGCECV
jgi:hypothetical protein